MVEVFMNGTEVVCSKCGALARLTSSEGEVFPFERTEKPMLFQVIECPQCGRREQPDGHDGYGRAVNSPA
jgi:hypothetical protein